MLTSQSCMTDQGQQTRLRLLLHIAPGETVTRQQLMERSGLSYQQVRRQAKNLCVEGLLYSHLEDGKRVYSFGKNFTVPELYRPYTPR